jgi:toxin ParE1/3/4
VPYKISRRAERDLADIYRFTLVAFGPQQAERYLVELGSIFELLNDQPGMGRPYDAATRQFVHGSHVIFYRSTAAGILVGRILHGSRSR